jgi:Tfp pilus assembly protein PilX
MRPERRSCGTPEPEGVLAAVNRFLRPPHRFITSLFQRLGEEEGVALILALALTTVLGIVGSTVMVYSSRNYTSASRSSADSLAYTRAEAGVNNAMAVISNPSNNALQQAVLPNCATGQYMRRPLTGDDENGGFTLWCGTLTGSTWSLWGGGYQHHSTESSGYVKRFVKVQTTVRPSFMQPPNTIAWNYIIALRTGTPGGCDLDLNNNMETPSSIEKGIDRTMVVVKGRTTLDVNTNIGASNAYIDEMHSAGGCSYKGGVFHNPCGTADKVFSTISDASPPPLVPPTADFAGWYTSAAPGPRVPCTTSSGVVPIFDGDTVANNSVGGVFNLTPSGTDYSCVVTAAGRTIGQLSWNHTTKKLTVLGTIYIDGSVCICGAGLVSYDGQASLYLGGTFQVFNSTFCGQISGTTCAWADPPTGWDPNNEMLMVVANGSGGQNPSGDSVQVKNAQFQGGLFSTYAIEIDTTSQTEGPMIASTEILGQTITGHTWTTITSVPSGAPGTPVVYAQPDPPGNYEG